MRNATELMVQYATCHRDRRSIMSHFVGVPMIVFAVGALLARPELSLLGLVVTPGALAFAAAAVWYFTRGKFALGLATRIVPFAGHHDEGRQPAFVDDLIGLLVGPMFVVGDWLFLLGRGKGLLAEIEQRVDPTQRRDQGGPAPARSRA